jgi:hypothetical protein
MTIENIEKRYTLRVHRNRIRLSYINAEDDTVQTETFKRIPNYISEFYMSYTSMRGNSSASFSDIEMTYEETKDHIRKNWLPKVPLADQISIQKFFSININH